MAAAVSVERIARCIRPSFLVGSSIDEEGTEGGGCGDEANVFNTEKAALDLLNADKELLLQAIHDRFDELAGQVVLHAHTRVEALKTQGKDLREFCRKAYAIVHDSQILLKEADDFDFMQSFSVRSEAIAEVGAMLYGHA
jgi:hypothetical protein